MVRSQLPEVMQAGINISFDDAGKNVESYHDKIFGTPKDFKKKDSVYKSATVTGFGTMRKKQENGPAPFDEIQRGRQLEIVPDSFALNWEMSQEMKDDNLVDLMNKMGSFAGTAKATSLQLSAFVTIGRGFGGSAAGIGYPSNTSTTAFSTQGTTYKGPDGVTLYNSSHPIAGTAAASSAGLPMPQTYSNILTSSPALTESTLAAAILLKRLMPNERGIPVRTTGGLILMVPPALELVMNQILHSMSTTLSTSGQPFSSGVNNLVSGQKITGFVNEYLLDPNDWFLFDANCTDEFLFIPKNMDEPLAYDFDINKRVYIGSAFARWAFGWTAMACRKSVGAFVA